MFAKYHGLGNDFVIVEGTALMSAAEAVALCHRNRGIGGDGVLSILPSRTPEAAFRMHLYNADGSVAEMCGNGLRCVVRHKLGAASAGERVVVDTDGGPRWGLTRAGGAVKVGLGRPEILQDRLTVEVDGRTFSGVSISMGNPHFVLTPIEPGLELAVLARTWGARIENHPAFPARTNVELFRPAADGGIDVVVWERGAGLTQACGTGAGATRAAAEHWGLVRSGPVSVRLPGGALSVTREEDGEIAIEGEAVHVFSGNA